MRRKVHFVVCCCRTELVKIAILFIFRIVAIILSVVLPLILSALLTSLISNNVSSISYLFGALILCNILICCINYVIRRIDLIASKNTNYQTKKKVSEMLLSLPNYNRSFSQGKMYSLMNSDANSVYALVSLFSTLFISVIKIAIISIIVLRTNWILALILMTPYPTIAYLNIHFRGRIKNAAEAVLAQNDSYLEIIKNSFGNIQEVVMQGGNSKLHESICEAANLGRKLAIKQILVQVDATQLISIASMLGYFLLTGVGVWFVLDKVISFGNFLAFGSFSKALSGSIDSIINTVTNLQPLMASVNRLFELQEDYEGFVLQQSTKKIPGDKIESIEFEHTALSFGEKVVLKNVNLNFNRGHIIGIVGSNGSGKTSLMNIVMQNLCPTDGKFKINGIDAFEYDYKKLRSRFEYVGAHKNMYFVTVRDNILLSCNRSSQELDDVCKTVGIYDDIMNLPNGYDTMISSEFVYSSGQMQKIQLARAFLKNSDVLILDEAMSNLDALARERVHSKLKKIARDKIIFVISHSKLDYAVCDEIYLINEGGITAV